MNWVLSDLLDAGVANEAEKDPNWIWRHHSTEVTGIASAKDVIATVSLDETCHLLCSASGSIYRTINVKRPLTAVTIGNDLLFLGDENGFLNVYELSDGVVDLEQKLFVKIHNSQIFSLSLSADFCKLITASEQCFKIISCARKRFKCLMSIAAQGKLTNAFFALKPRVFTTDLDSAPMDIHIFGIAQTSVNIVNMKTKFYSVFLISSNSLPTTAKGDMRKTANPEMVESEVDYKTTNGFCRYCKLR
ncbi:hypothetical protein CEXT_398181 [Caerostris extrusa]|uniref:Uncharacterized protein n=1 Tax=Caerostris extrusa TaxID=172846 RepID=A0AAV4NFZ1_CAEEX|nr:hypothetical protein CEXT_398181 [Caerostris extrusa]